jgi:hypothetical protein
MQAEIETLRDTNAGVARVHLPTDPGRSVDSVSSRWAWPGAQRDRRLRGADLRSRRPSSIAIRRGGLRFGLWRRWRRGYGEDSRWWGWRIPSPGFGGGPRRRTFDRAPRKRWRRARGRRRWRRTPKEVGQGPRRGSRRPGRRLGRRVGSRLQGGTRRITGKNPCLAPVA